MKDIYFKDLIKFIDVDFSLYYKGNYIADTSCATFDLPDWLLDCRVELISTDYIENIMEVYLKE